MLADIKEAATRSSTTLVQDAAGVAALVVMLVVGLCLPALI